jgi:hypothetical protein
MRIAYCDPKNWVSPTPVQGIGDLGGDVVAQVVLIVAAVDRFQSDDESKVPRRLGDRQTLLLDFQGQQSGRRLQLVLYLHLGGVGVGSLGKGHGDRGRARRVAGRGEVDQVVEPLHLLLDDLSGGVLERLGVGAWEDRGHRDLRRRQGRELGDRQRADGQGSGQEEHQSDHPGEDGPIDEKTGHVGSSFRRRRGAGGPWPPAGD